MREIHFDAPFTRTFGDAKAKLLACLAANCLINNATQ